MLVEVGRRAYVDPKEVVTVKEASSMDGSIIELKSGKTFFVETKAYQVFFIINGRKQLDVSGS